MSHYQALKDIFYSSKYLKASFQTLLLTQFCRDFYVADKRTPKLYHADNNMDPGLEPLKLMVCVVK